MTEISATASVDRTAELEQDVVIGPGCVIGPHTVIGAGSELLANVYVGEGVVIGRGNRLHANCVLGDDPQIRGLRKPPTALVIGSNNVMRENVTINRGSPHGSGITKVGDNNYFMIGCHVGHDAEIEDNAVIGNYAQLAGHVKIESNAWIGALNGMHQFVTIGRFVYTGGLTGISHDIPPFTRVAGLYPSKVRGLNVVGMTRAGFSPESIADLRKAYKRLFMTHKPITGTVAEMLEEGGWDENVLYLLEFLQRSFRHSQGRYRETLRRQTQTQKQ